MQARLIAGDSLKFTAQVPDYPASAGYTLKYRLVRRDGTPGDIVITATGSGDEYLVEVTPAITVDWTPGVYTWAAQASKTGERYTVQSGEVEIVADPVVSTAPFDMRTQAETALAAAKAAFAAWDGTRKTVTINGRSVTFNSPAEILTQISYWETQVQGEADANAIANGLRSKRNIYVRFGNV